MPMVLGSLFVSCYHLQLCVIVIILFDFAAFCFHFLIIFNVHVLHVSVMNLLILGLRENTRSPVVVGFHWEQFCFFFLLPFVNGLFAHRLTRSSSSLDYPNPFTKTPLVA